MADPITFTEPQAARMLGVSARTLARWRAMGAVGHSLTPGGRRLYAQADIDRLRDEMRVPATLGRAAGMT